MSTIRTSPPPMAEAPSRVLAAQRFFQEHGLWHLFSRNSLATSCREAAARRTRMGNQGIPLHDEMRSLAVVTYDGTERGFALLHCRASQYFDLDRAAKVLGTPPPLARISTAELGKLQIDYGTVNPFSEPELFCHVFDPSVLDELTLPQTMMTNAGSHTWAVEFRPREVVTALERVTRVRVAPICRGAPTPTPASFGILTGNGPESGALLWERINRQIDLAIPEDTRLIGDFRYPRVMVQSEPGMGLSMELSARREDVWEVIRAALDRFVQAELSHVAIACNTTQAFEPQIREHLAGTEVEFVSLPQAVSAHMIAQGIQEFTVLGIPAVGGLAPGSTYAALQDIGARPTGPKALPYLQELGYLVKDSSLKDLEVRAANRLRDAVNKGADCETVLVALTEISVLLKRAPRLARVAPGKQLVDALELYASRLATIYLSSLRTGTLDGEAAFEGNSDGEEGTRQ